MLNILLSALMDPDRRLRSFRRSERLASILVRMPWFKWGVFLPVLCMHFCKTVVKTLPGIFSFNIL